MLHYAWPATVANHSWAFNKHDMTGFRADACPARRADLGSRGLFAHPPSPRLLRSQVSQRIYWLTVPCRSCGETCLCCAMQAGQYVRDLLNIEVVTTLNMAFCELHHKKACSGENVRRECGKVGQIKVTACRHACAMPLDLDLLRPSPYSHGAVCRRRSSCGRWMKRGDC